jgi:hypothetical protein
VVARFSSLDGMSAFSGERIWLGCCLQARSRKDLDFGASLRIEPLKRPLLSSFRHGVGCPILSSEPRQACRQLAGVIVRVPSAHKAGLVPRSRTTVEAPTFAGCGKTPFGQPF